MLDVVPDETDLFAEPAAAVDEEDGKPPGVLAAAADGGEQRILLLALEDGERRLQGRCRHLLDGPIPALLEYQTDTSPELIVPLIRAWLRRNGHRRPLVILRRCRSVLVDARLETEDELGGSWSQ